MNQTDEETEVVLVEATPLGILYLILDDIEAAKECIEALASYCTRFVRTDWETGGIIFTDDCPDGRFVVLTPPPDEEVVQ